MLKIISFIKKPLQLEVLTDYGNVLRIPQRKPLKFKSAISAEVVVIIG